MRPDTQHYLIVDGGVVVAKRAIGPDQQADGSWTLPPAPEGSTLVDHDTYLSAHVGEHGRMDERLARLLAQGRKLAEQVNTLATALTAVQATVTTQGQQIAKGRADLKALADRVTALEQR